MANKKINRIKVMLAEKGRTNKWLAVQVGKDPATISKWCTNAAQPSLEMLLQVAKVLEVEVKDLIREQDEKQQIQFAKTKTYIVFRELCRMSAFFVHTFAIVN